MRTILPALAVATLVGLASAPAVLAQNLPSDVEQRLGVRLNSGDRDGRGYGGRELPSDMEQQMRR